MIRRLSRYFVSLMAVFLAVVALAPADAGAKRATAVVMSRNLYLGADLTGAIGATTPDELFLAAADSYQNVVDTNFPERAKLLAAEIEDTAPDLVGLQEAALWRTGAIGDPEPAEDVAYDFLAILDAELGALGLGYTPAVVQENFDIEIPATFTSDGAPILQDVRLTMRNVILVKSGVAYSNVQQAHFENNATYQTIAGEIVDLRGWVAIDVDMGRRPFRFVNTHLESYQTAVRTLQAQEIVDGPLATNMKVVALGDFNTPPEGPESGAYQILVDRSNGKMHDAWRVSGADPGLTCCQEADLTNVASTAYTRIDLVLTRTAAVKTNEIFLTGTTAKTPDGLWASDHFGVVAILSIP
jgi:endonuclease/exonuclease/phosphatase family metal-dependent hydrolase